MPSGGSFQHSAPKSRGLDIPSLSIPVVGMSTIMIFGILVADLLVSFSNRFFRRWKL